MENIALYIAKACSLTVVFYAAYYLLLRKETFFRANRWFLLAGMATSVLLPLAVFTKIVWIQAQPVSNVTVTSLSQVVAVKSVLQPAALTGFQFEWWMFALAVYILVSAVLFTRLIVDFKHIISLLKGQSLKRVGPFKIIDSKAAKSPFSFFNYIVYNSSTLDSTELQDIVSHEKVHSRQHHSVDLLLAQLFCIAFWFNPIAWLYKKAIAQNLEFIADAEAVKHLPDITGYQKTLLKITMDLQHNSLANHFYQPLIKKRIIMINKPKSKKRNTVKYAVVLPLLAVFVGLFQIKTEARVKDSFVQLEKNTPTDTLVFKSIKFTLTKDTADKVIKENMALIADTYNINADYDLDRNDKNEIIYVIFSFTGNGLDKVYEDKNKTPIKDLCIELSRNEQGLLSASFSNPIDKEEPAYVTVSANNLSYTGDNALAQEEPDNIIYVINGVKQTDGTGLKNLDPYLIESIVVLKDASAVEKYGKEAKNGVIVVTTKKERKTADDDNNAVTQPHQPVIIQNSSITIEKNGKAESKISSWSVQGAVEVSDTPKGGGPKFTLENDGNSGFIIKKESTENDLDFYVKTLAQNGITMKYSGIKRNDRGEITKIKIELIKDGNKAKGDFESSTGIEKIYVGEKSGKLIAYSMK